MTISSRDFDRITSWPSRALLPDTTMSAKTLEALETLCAKLGAPPLKTEAIRARDFYVGMEADDKAGDVIVGVRTYLDGERN